MDFISETAISESGRGVAPEECPGVVVEGEGRRVTTRKTSARWLSPSRWTDIEGSRLVADIKRLVLVSSVRLYVFMSLLFI